jgi:hypothetical protein
MCGGNIGRCLQRLLDCGVQHLRRLRGCEHEPDEVCWRGCFDSRRRGRRACQRRLVSTAARRRSWPGRGLRLSSRRGDRANVVHRRSAPRRCDHPAPQGPSSRDCRQRVVPPHSIQIGVALCEILPTPGAVCRELRTCRTRCVCRICTAGYVVAHYFGKACSPIAVER